MYAFNPRLWDCFLLHRLYRRRYRLRSCCCTLPWGASANASGSNSAKTIQTMQPAAKPRASGRRTRNASTNRNDGTATKGWGIAVKSVQSSADRGDMPLATSTVETANPSGILCSPMAIVTNTPCRITGWELTVKCTLASLAPFRASPLLGCATQLN